MYSNGSLAVPGVLRYVITSAAGAGEANSASSSARFVSSVSRCTVTSFALMPTTCVTWVRATSRGLPPGWTANGR